MSTTITTVKAERESCRVGSFQEIGLKTYTGSKTEVKRKEVRINGAKLLRTGEADRARVYIGRNTRLHSFGSANIEKISLSDDDSAFQAKNHIITLHLRGEKYSDAHTTDIVSAPQRRQYWIHVLLEQLRLCVCLHTLRLCSDWILDIHIAWSLQNCFKGMLALKELDLSTTTKYGGFGIKEMELLCTGMKKLVYLQKLNLAGNILGNSGALQLSSVLRHLNFLQVLDLHNCHVGQYGIGDICESVVKHVKKIQILRFGIDSPRSRNATIGVGSFCFHMSQLTNANLVLSTLITLDMSGNEIGDIGFSYLVKEFERGCLPEVRCLNLIRNVLSDKSANLIGCLFQRGHFLKLQSLNLCENNITMEGATHIVSQITGLQYLQEFLGDYKSFDELCTKYLLNLPQRFCA